MSAPRQPTAAEAMMPSRLDPQHPWAQWAAASIEATLERPPMVVPNLGGSLPNDIFADVIGVPTIWVPHSYASCSQHAPNEHLLAPIVRDSRATVGNGQYQAAFLHPSPHRDRWFPVHRRIAHQVRHQPAHT